MFALRGADGSLRAFRNVCRHQSMQVVEKPSGNSAQLRCRYHGWTYDSTGRFVAAPDTVAPSDPSSASNDLHELHSAQVNGFLLFTQSAGGSLDNRAFDALLTDASHEPASESYAGAVTAEIGCNWKTYLEHRLAPLQAGQSRFAWLWPLLLAIPVEAGLIVEQVIPRTFLRTRVVFHRLGSASAQAAQNAADSAKTACEALQAQRASGVMVKPSGLLADFHERLDAAIATDAGAETRNGDA